MSLAELRGSVDGRSGQGGGGASSERMTREGALCVLSPPEWGCPACASFHWGGSSLPVFAWVSDASKLNFKKESWKANVDRVYRGRSGGKGKSHCCSFLFFNFNFFFWFKEKKTNYCSF